MLVASVIPILVRASLWIFWAENVPNTRPVGDGKTMAPAFDLTFID